MKIQIYFSDQKKFRFVFNENTYFFLLEKIFRSIFSENTDLFLFLKNVLVINSIF